MSLLFDAIDAEVRGDLPKAVEAYRRLSDEGTPLDRIGIHQALARCLERMGELGEAASWRREAARGFMALPDDAMPGEERRYYALLEARQAVQDLAGTEAVGEVSAEYKDILAENWKAGPEGLTHEGLFGALFLRGQGDWTTSARYFFDVAEAVNEQWTEGGSTDEGLRALAIRGYELAEETAMKAGRSDVARVANLRALALRGGSRPQPLGGP